MAVTVTFVPSQVLRPTRGSRVAGFLILLFGVLFGLFWLAGDLSGGVTMGVAGAIFAAVGLSLVTARVVVGREGLRYRNGVRGTSIPAAEVSSVGVGAGSGAFYSRLAVVVRTSSGRIVRLTALQGAPTDATRARLEGQVALIRSELGVPDGGE